MGARREPVTGFATRAPDLMQEPVPALSREGLVVWQIEAPDQVRGGRFLFGLRAGLIKTGNHRSQTRRRWAQT